MPTNIQIAILLVGFLLFLLGVFHQKFEAFGVKLPHIPNPKLRWLSLGLGAVLLLTVPTKEILFTEKLKSSAPVQSIAISTPNSSVIVDLAPPRRGSRPARIPTEKDQKQNVVAGQKRVSEAYGTTQVSKQEITNDVKTNNPKSTQIQQMSDSPGGVQIGNVGSITLNQSPVEISARLRSELTKLLRFPEAVPDDAKARTTIERRLANKLPSRVFDLLMRYDEKNIFATPEIGNTLYNFLTKYYQFRQRASNLEELSLIRIGQIVPVRFRSAWDIYFRYAVTSVPTFPKNRSS